MSDAPAPDYAAQSRADSSAVLPLPAGHPGYVPASNEPWQPYERCAGCGRLVSRHVPSARERSEQGVVPGLALADGRMACTMACLYRKNPKDPLFKGVDPASMAYDLKMLEIGDLERQLATLRGGGAG